MSHTKKENDHTVEPTVSGYHVSTIQKGVYGELSKIREELDEAVDAEAQGSSIMLLVELSDLYGALEAVAEKHSMKMDDLKSMSDITKRAFRSGARS